MEPLAHKCSRDTFSRQVADGEVTRAQNRPHFLLILAILDHTVHGKLWHVDKNINVFIGYIIFKNELQNAKIRSPLPYSTE